MASTGYGHGDQEPWLDTSVTSAQPGERFTLIGGELGSGATVRLGVLVNDQSRSLGIVSADEDGHFVSEVTAPADVEQLYVQLRAHSDAGVEASMWFLVGDPNLLVPSPAAAEEPSALSDPSVILLGLMVTGALVIVAWLFLKRGRATMASERASKPRRVSDKRRPPTRD